MYPEGGRCCSLGDHLLRMDLQVSVWGSSGRAAILLLLLLDDGHPEEEVLTLYLIKIAVIIIKLQFSVAYLQSISKL